MSQHALIEPYAWAPDPRGTPEPWSPGGGPQRVGELSTGWPYAGPAPGPGPGPEPTPTGSLTDVVRVALLTLSAVVLGLALNLELGSGVEHQAAQTRLFDSFRQQLALGTAPLGPTGPHRRPLSLGTPIALLQIPSIGVKEVVGEGTTSAVLMSGPGHVRSTIFPGGAGTSIIFGRAAAYGGPFGRLDELHKGESIKVVTQVGSSTFRVVDTRRAGDVVPPLAAGSGRLTLATATGSRFVPSGVLWVDADLVGTPLPAASPAVHRVPANESPLGIDTGSLWVLALWLGVLALVLTGAVWTWHRRGHAQTWIIFSAPVIVAAYVVASHASLLLPNLM